MVVTGAPRKRLVRKGTWVRIPPSPPNLTSRFLNVSAQINESTILSALATPRRGFVGVFGVVRQEFASSAISACHLRRQDWRPLLVVNAMWHRSRRAARPPGSYRCRSARSHVATRHGLNGIFFIARSDPPNEAFEIGHVVFADLPGFRVRRIPTAREVERETLEEFHFRRR